MKAEGFIEQVSNTEWRIVLDFPDRLVESVTKAPEGKDRPTVVCLCGSTRFYDEFQRAIYDETMSGKIVLSVGFYPHSSKQAHGQSLGCAPEQKKALDELHKRKIDIADEVYVLNVGGYIGESTRSEIEYADKYGKPVRYLEQAETPKQCTRPDLTTCHAKIGTGGVCMNGFTCPPVDDNLAKEPEEKFLCPNCKKVWDTKKYNACECGAALKQSPPVDDNLAKARDLCLNIKENHRDITFCTAVDKIETAYESAIRERDEKLAQSMTVEELKDWYEEWNYANGYSCSFVFFVSQKIKERNEKKDGE